MTVQQHGNDFVSNGDPGRLSLNLIPSLIIVAERERQKQRYENREKNKNRCQELIVFAGNHDSVISVTFLCF